jgi:hypothetical protein
MFAKRVPQKPKSGNNLRFQQQMNVKVKYGISIGKYYSVI